MTITAADHCIWTWAHWSAAAVPQLTASTVQHGAEMENWRIQSTFLTPGPLPCVL